jgi:hypothetical protein
MYKILVVIVLFFNSKRMSRSFNAVMQKKRFKNRFYSNAYVRGVM